MTVQEPVEYSAAPSNTASGDLVAQAPTNTTARVFNPAPNTTLETPKTSAHETKGQTPNAQQPTTAHATTEGPNNNTPGHQADSTQSNDPKLNPFTPADPLMKMIKDLNPLMTEPWRLCARVISRGPTRTWQNDFTSGTLIEVFLADANSQLVRATLFNAAVTKFLPLLEPGKCCTLSNGKIKYTMKTNLAHPRQIELTFGDKAEIATVNSNVIPPPSFTTTDITSLATLPTGAEVSVLGVLLNIGTTKRFMTAKAKPVTKRNITLVDKTNTKLVCTLWGSAALDNIDEFQGKPVLVKDGQINDYNGTRSLSINVGASLLTDPALPTATDLTAWYANGINEHVLGALASP